MRIKAALDAREESGSDIVIIARTDSRQAISLEEALWRSRAFADAGADALFIDALASIEEMKAFCEITPLLPKVVIFFYIQCYVQQLPIVILLLIFYKCLIMVQNFHSLNLVSSYYTMHIKSTFLSLSSELSKSCEVVDELFALIFIWKET